jgi:hypothetical protein
VRHGWVRDIADFAKYGLLKRLAGNDLRLGVFWYLTTHAAANAPLVSYLSRPDRYRACDGALFDTLRRLHIEKGDKLTLEDIERGNVLPSNTVFYSRLLSTTAIERTGRRSARDQWFQEGCAITPDCNLVFLDPDTGLLPTGRKAENAGGEEYALIEEVISLCQRGQSVVCVQFGSPGNFEREPEIARARLAALGAALNANGFPEPWGLWWRDGHKVGLLVAPSTTDSDILRLRRDDILNDPAWKGKIAPLLRRPTD